MEALPSPIMKKTIEAPTPKTQAEIETLISAILRKQAEGQVLMSKREADLTEARQKIEDRHQYTAKIEQLDAQIVEEIALVEAWAIANPEAFGDNKTMVLAGAKFGFVAGRWSVIFQGEGEDKEKEAAAIKKLLAIVERGEKPTASAKAKKAAETVQRWLKTEVKFVKSAALKDRKDATMSSLLYSAGVAFSLGADKFTFERAAS